MSESEKSNLDHLPSRRVFVKTSTAAAVGLLGAWGAKPAETAAQEPPVVALTKEARDQMTADQILEKWKEGNRRFREGRKIQRDFLAEQQATASGQFPAGVLLSCIDSRAPAEILFNLGMGDIFNARIAATSRTPTSSAAWSSPRSSPGRRWCLSWATRRVVRWPGPSPTPSLATSRNCLPEDPAGHQGDRIHRGSHGRQRGIRRCGGAQERSS